MTIRFLFSSMIIALLLGACATGQGNSNTQMYGEVKTGYETSTTRY